MPERMEPHLDILRVQLEALTELTRAGFDRLDGRFEKLEVEVTRVDRKFEGEVRRVDGEVNSLKEWRANVEGRDAQEKQGGDWVLRIVLAVLAVAALVPPFVNLLGGAT